MHPVKFACVAQLVEPTTDNRVVPGSNPGAGTRLTLSHSCGNERGGVTT